MKKALKYFVFLLCLSLSLQYTLKVLSFKNSDGIYALEHFYKQEPNTLDVMFFGTSHTFQGISNPILWNEYGITSFDLAGSIQPIWNTYHYVQESLKTQSPELLVIDLYALTLEDEYAEQARIVKNTFGMKNSMDKIEAKIVSTPSKERTSYLLEYPLYHSRYGELTKEDFSKYKAKENFYSSWKGNGVNFDTKKILKHNVKAVTERTELSEKNEVYLRKILELSKAKDIPVLLVVIPYKCPEADQKVYNTALDIANEYALPFVNFNILYDEIGLSFNQDFADESHLNYVGSEKFTKYLGAYLKKNYALEDHKNDVKVTATFDAAYKYYKYQLIDNEFRLDKGSILKGSKDKNMITMGFIKHDKLSESEITVFKSLGFDDEMLKTDCYFVINDSQVEYYSTSDDFINYPYYQNDDTLYLRKNKLSFNYDNVLTIDENSTSYMVYNTITGEYHLSFK